MLTRLPLHRTILLICLGMVPLYLAAEEDLKQSAESWRFTNNKGQDLSAKHRIDISTIFYDGDKSDSLDLLLGYTYNISADFNVGVTIPYGDPSITTDGNSGFGDTSLVLSYVPYASLNANPWAPKTVGSGFGILLPTGSKNNSLDTWVLAPFFGSVVPLTDKISFIPNISYSFSLDETAVGADIRLGAIQAGLLYVTPQGAWISYFPEFVHDYELHEGFVNHGVTIGTMFTKRIGISAEYMNIERAKPLSGIVINEGSDHIVTVDLHVVF